MSLNSLIAQVDIGKELIIKDGKSIGSASQFQSPGSLISVILPNVYMAAGVLFLVLLIFGGISIILGAGQNDPKKAAQGQKTATTAVIGFLIIFASYWIIQIIEVVTGIKIFNPVF